MTKTKEEPVESVAIILDTPEQIETARLCTLKAALKLEIAGMGRRGPSAYSILKSEFGLKGNKTKVLTQAQVLVEKALAG